MASVETPTASGGLVEALRRKLQDAPTPLKLTDAAKGLPKPKKTKTAELQDEVRKLLEEEVRLGRAFRHPSGKAGEIRYWVKDEENLIREKALEVAAKPLSLSALVTAIGKEVKGTDKIFIEARLRDLIGEELLHEHPQPGKKGGSLFGAAPPPPPLPPLDHDKHRKVVAKLAADCRKLMTTAGVTAEELLKALRSNLLQTKPGPLSETTQSVAPAKGGEKDCAGARLEASALEELILKAVGTAPVLSLAELRREMPREFQGPVFDETVLRLADEHQVYVAQDIDPAALSPEERAMFVQDGGTVFTSIARWS